MNERDYGEWVDERRPALVQYAALVTRNSPDAEDAVQDALASVQPRWRHLDPDTAERYVRRSIANAATSAWRRWRAREVPSPELPDRPHDTFAERVSDADLAWRLCGDLPPDQRAAIVMRYFEDATFETIAATLGCEVSTARSHVHRALARMRQALATQEIR